MSKVYLTSDMKPLTRYLLMPFHAAPLILMVTFTILWFYGIKGGIFGIFLDVILVSWFFKYCFALLDAVVAGHDELPVLSVEMLNPVDEQRPLIQLAITGLGAIASWWAYHAIGPIAGVVLGALLLSALPATVGLLAISDSWVHALSPLAIGRMMKGLGLTYLAMLAVTLGGAAVVSALAMTLDSTMLILALSQLVFMGMFCFVGGAIFESRVDLQLATRTHGERLAERHERNHAEDRGAVLDRTYALLRLQRRSEAWAHLESWMLKHCPDSHPFTEYHALLVATCAWEDNVIGDRVANEYLEKLLTNGETGLAVEALEIRLRTNPTFYPQDAAMAARLIELAMLSGRKVAGLKLQANAPA
ncbi:MAG TPA: hypothetical protein VK696_05210 [Steroidobacteraceae bacterium]|jgi:hypothetical protein|nr:hypothetical protein [Steroidobacteraceae bacterium]